MHHRNVTTERLSANFERFNPYAAKAMELDEDAEVYANLAVAFELGQLRYQLTKRLPEGDAVPNAA